MRWELILHLQYPLHASTASQVLPLSAFVGQCLHEQHIHSFHGYLNGAGLASVQPCPQKAPSRADMWQVQLKGPLHLNHFLQLLIIMLVLWPLKGICSNQHDIDHDPTGPYVSNLHRHTQSCSCPEAALNWLPIAPSLYFQPLEQCINRPNALPIMIT